MTSTWFRLLLILVPVSFGTSCSVGNTAPLDDVGLAWETSDGQQDAPDGVPAGKDSCPESQEQALCVDSSLCRSDGYCDVTDGRCVAAKPASCASSLGCAVAGKCTYLDGDCRAKVPSGETCLSTLACTLFGDCGEKSGFCLAESDSHCAQSRVCQRHARCTVSQGRCVAQDADCKQSNRCVTSGWCSAKLGRCVPTPEGCASSTSCELTKYCAYSSGLRCTRSPDATTACLETAPCKNSGACSVVGGSCGGATDVSCKQSLGCTESGICSESFGVCRRCQSSGCRTGQYAPCKISGQCDAWRGICVPRSDADCLQSTACKVAGLCRHVGVACRAVTDSDCASSDGCAKSGFCYMDYGRCIKEQ